MLLAVRISSSGFTWEVWRALKKLELLSAAPRATLILLSCSPDFPRASITRYTHAKHEPVLKFRKGKYFFLMYHLFASSVRFLYLDMQMRVIVSSDGDLEHISN